MNLTDAITRIAQLDDEATAIIAALDKHMRNESDHAWRGGLARLRTALVDFRHGVRQARAQYSAKRPA